MMSEKELCQKFISMHPRPECLYFEVGCYGGIADIVYFEAPVVTIYEGKTSLTAKLLEQCVERKKCAHYVYAVIPEGKRNSFMTGLFKQFGIGIISVSSYGSKTELHYDSSPRINRKIIAPALEDFHKTNDAGAKNGRVTGFGNMINLLKKFITDKGGIATIDACFPEQSYYATPKQFKSNIYQWINKGIITGLKMYDGNIMLDTYTAPKEQQKLEL